MKRINFRRVFLVSGLAALVIVYAVLFVRMLATPAERTGSDYISAYTGGRVADLWGAANAYNLDYQQAVQAQVVGFDLAPGQVLMFNHPPYLLPALALIMDEDYLASLIRYALVMVALYAAALAVFYRLLRADGWERGPAWLALAGMATFYPLFVSLVNTQDTALMVLGGCLWLLGLRRKKDWLAGVGLALTTVRPHVALLLAIPFLFRRGGVFWWFCLSAAVLGGISLLAVGTTGLVSYARILLTAAGGEWFGMHENAMINLVGLLIRLFPGAGGVIHWIGWGTFFTALAGLCVLWARSRELQAKHIVLLIVCAVFFPPHLHYHDLALLLVAFTAALPELSRNGRIRQTDAGPILLSCSLILLLGWMVAFLKYNLPYLMMLALVLSLRLPPGKLFQSPMEKENI